MLIRWVKGVGPIVARNSGTMMLIVWTLAVLMPFGWTIMTSFKTEAEMRRHPFALPTSIISADGPITPTQNYRNAWREMNFADYFRNSLAVVLVSLVLILVIATPAAYALARLQLPGRKIVLIYLMSGMMIPAQLILVPLFFQYSEWSAWMTSSLAGPLKALGWQSPIISLHDSHIGLILIYVAMSLSFSIFILTNFFRSLPTALYEAGIIDGCSEWQAFRYVMLPLARSGLVTVAIFNFLALWNEYLFALVFINDESLRTLPLGLANLSIQANYRTSAKVDAGVLFAGLVIVMLPALAAYLILQKRLVRGITIGAVKG